MQQTERAKTKLTHALASTSQGGPTETLMVVGEALSWLDVINGNGGARLLAKRMT